MRVPQRLDYALRVLTVLAELPEGSSAVAGDIADRLNLPRRFVEQQFTLLARQGIVACQRGPNGGCTLARPAADITVEEVVRAIQGDVLDVPAVTGSAVSEVWAQAADALTLALGAVSLGDLATRQRLLDTEAEPVYCI